jgi:hypothetical protein
MTEKGFAYVRTEWAYGERPVTAAKMNAWDANIARGFAIAWRLTNHLLGGGDGVVAGLEGALQVAAMTPPTLETRVAPGVAFIEETPFVLAQAVDTLAITPPTIKARVDLVQARLDDWSITVKEGAEDDVPETPEPDPASLALAALYLRPGMTVIKNTDDGVNGYIEDLRVLLAG